ncbi:hypothetical protein JE959_000211 [Aeromonas veronii]|nr:hypothetical protein [Aeromonas veronii]
MKEILDIAHTYADKNYVLGVLKNLVKNKIISQTISTHFEMMIEDREYFYEQFDSKIDIHMKPPRYSSNMSFLERVSPVLPYPTAFSLDFHALPSPLNIAMDIYIIEHVFLKNEPIFSVYDRVQRVCDYVRSISGTGGNHEVFDSTLMLISETRTLAMKTQCVDHFKVSKVISDLMSKTNISDKVPCDMILPTRRVTNIELPRGSGLRVFNSMSGWHELDAITVFRSDYPAYSGGTKNVPQDMLDDAGIDESTPFTNLVFFFDGRPNDGSSIFDDGTYYINLFIKDEDKDKPLLKSLEDTLAREGSEHDIFMKIAAEDRDIGLLEYPDGRRSTDLARLVKFASSVMLFVNSNYARKEFVPSVSIENAERNIRKINKKKFAVKVRKETFSPAFTKIYFHSNEGDSQSVHEYMEQIGRHGASVTPHWREPHWRTQHYGPENKLIKLVFIAPVFVGGKNLDGPMLGRNRKI